MNLKRLYQILFCFLLTTSIVKITNAQCDVLITQQPTVPVVVCVGPGSQTLSVSASVKAGGTLSYQWYFNGQAITTGGTGSTYTISNLQPSSNGEYKVKVSGACDITQKQDVISNPVSLTLGNTPLLNTVLPDETICVGANFSTSVNANTRNGGSVSYSWRYINTNTTVSSASTLSINGVTSTDAGRYSVTVSNSCGIGQSDTMTLSTRNKPVSTALNNTSITSCQGQSVVLQTETNNNGAAVSYTWYKVISGTPVLLPNEISSNYSIGSLQPGDAGTYRFLASNICGAATNPVDFIINAPKSKPIIVAQPQSANVNCTDYTLALSVTGSSDAGNISYAWTKGAASLEANTQIVYTNGGNTSSLIFSDPNPLNNGIYTVSLSNNCGTIQSAPVNVNVDVVRPVINTAPNARVVCETQSLIESPTINYQEYFNFTYAWYKVGSGTPVANSRELVISSFSDVNAGDYKLRVTNSCGTFTESVPVAFAIARKPNITTQPSLGAQIACINKNITLSAAANTQNGGTLSYTWYKDNSLISGQQTAILALTSMQSNAQGSYRVDVSNQCGITASNSVQVSLGNIPTLEAKTQDSSYCYGSNVTLALTANSNNGGVLAYQWSSSSDGVLVNTSSSYVINSLIQSKTGSYSVQVSNACGTMATPVVMVVRGLDKPVVTQFTSNGTTFCTGSNLNLSVGATSTSTMVYNWYRGNTLVKANSNDNYYQKGGLGLSDAGAYSVSVSNICGASTSSSITISVNGKPSIVTDITKNIDCSGSKSLQLTVAGADNGGGTIAYQWYKNGNPLGANSSTLLINNITSATSGTYFVSLSNGCGSVNSESAVVYINFDVPSIELQPKSGSYCEGQPLLLEVAVKDANSNNFSYQWTKSGSNIIGQTRPILSKDALVISDAGQYSVLVTGLCGVTTTSNLVDIVVRDAPSPSFIITSNTTQCLSSNAFDFTDNSNTSGSFVREWIFDDGSTSIVGPAVTHRFNTGGIHNVQLKHTAANGCSGSYSQNITVSSTPIITQQLKNKIACLGGDISLDILINENYGGNLIYTWKKNGAVITSANTTSGSYEIYGVSNSDKASYSVSVSNTCGTVHSDTVSISISDKPFLANAIATKNICTTNTDTVFVSMTSLLPVTKYTWYRNDGYYSNTVSPYLSFSDFKEENSGTFYVEAENACGTTRSNNFALNLKKLPQPTFSVTTDTVCYKSSKLISTAYSNNNNDTLIYQWYQNDIPLQSESKSSIFPVFGSPGVYSFKVQVTNSCGTITSPVTTTYVNRIVPQFIVDSTGGCNNNLSVSIQNRTSRFYYPLFRWKAMYDDGQEDELVLPTNFAFHKYNVSGNFNLKLVAFDSTGCSSDTMQFQVSNYAPAIADFKATDTCLGEKTIFTNLAQKGAGSFGYDFIRWETENQTIIDTSENVALQYQRPGIYNVAMSVRGKNSCITNRIEKKVVIVGNPQFLIDSVGGCKNDLNVTVTKTGTDYHIRNFLWNIDYGDGTKKVNLDSTFLSDNYKYAKSGTYTVRINTSGTLSCQNQSIVKTVVNYGIAKAAFSVSDTCVGFENTFFNRSTKGIGNTTFASVKWKMGNEWYEDSTLQFTYKFDRPGKYNVTMYVQGNNNCLIDSTSKEVNVIGNPEFVVDSSGSCTGKLMVTVNNINTDANIKNHFWEIDYGDGSRKKLLDSLMKTDSYTYTNPGNYQVKVSSRGALSCQTQTLTKIFTNVAVAKANFNVGDTCWGMPSLFKNTSVRGFGNTGYSFAKWYINNDVIEDTSSSINYTYQTPGTYRVSLHVQGNNSCVVDSISKQLVVTGYPTANFVYKDSCAGFDVLFTDISATSPNDKIAQWQWNFADKGTPLFIPNPIRSFKREGSYAVNLLVQSKTCPQFYHDTTINVTIIRPRRNLRYNTIYTVKDMQNKLDAYPSGRSYEWIPNLYLNNSRVKQPLINPDFVEKEYQVRIVDSSGCINVDTLMVWGFDKPDIYLPTAFSPNNDGYNDVYKAEYVMIEHLEYLKVLDKFNNIIFETKSMSESWDGMYKGRPVAADVYLVLVSAVDKRKQRIQKKVTVNLLR